MVNDRAVLEQEIKEYIREVKKGINCSRSRKKELLTEITESIHDFCSNEESVDISKIKERFGTPEEIAESVLRLHEANEVNKSLKVGKRIVIAVVIIALIVGSIVVGIQVLDYWKNENFREGYYVETVTQPGETPPVILQPGDRVY
ncbi:MAG: hypothetical protein J1E06_10800 [Acutalibacter sp.]|nr:hypothetical protein [Acutalibacter sp.]